MSNASISGDFVIRTATEDDVPAILSLIKELAEYERLSDEVVATEDGIRQALFGQRPVAEAIIGDYDGVPIGFALYFNNFSTFLGKPGIYLEDLYVQPDHRGNGFGRKLLAYVAHQAKERNCGRLEWAVLDWNEPAIDFYKRIDAVPMDDWTVYRLMGDALDNLANENPTSSSSQRS